MAALPRAVRSDTAGMHTTSSKPARFPLMWRIYIAAWVIYGVFLSFADQLDLVAAGRLDAPRWLLTFASLFPSAILLALAWPLTGLLERRGYRFPALAGIHLATAFAFSVVSQTPFWISFHNARPRSW